MGIKTFIGNLFGRAEKTGGKDAQIDWERARHESIRSKEFEDATDPEKESIAAGKLLKLITSPGFFALCLRETDTAAAYSEMIDSSKTDGSKAASESARLVGLFSEHAATAQRGAASCVPSIRGASINRRTATRRLFTFESNALRSRGESKASE
jgi:hypothetical protein